MRARERAVLVGILTAVAILLRVGFVHDTRIVDPLRADAGQYDRYAHNLREHGTFSLAGEGEPVRPDSLRGPGYPVFLAACYAVAGHDAEPQRTALYTQAALGGLVTPLVYRLGIGFLSPWAALAATALTALSPHQLALSGYLLSETLLGVLVLLALWLWSGAPTRARLLGAGCAFGAAALVHESTALLLPALWVLARGERKKLLLAFVPLVIALGVWQVRNRMQVGGEAVDGSRRAYSTLSHGAYPDFFYATEGYRYFPYLEDPAQPEFGRSLGGFLRVFGERAAERPWRYLSWYLFEKPYWLWSWNSLQGQPDVYVYPVSQSFFDERPVAGALKAALRTVHPAVLVLLLGGAVAFVVRRRRNAHLPRAEVAVFGSVLYLTAFCTVFAPWPRYSVPFRAEMFLAAGAALAWACRRSLTARGAAEAAAPVCRPPLPTAGFTAAPAVGELDTEAGIDSEPIDGDGLAGVAADEHTAGVGPAAG
jgi:hypothetical protein